MRASSSSTLVAASSAGQHDAGLFDLVTQRGQNLRRRRCGMAIDDGICVAEHAEQRPPAAATLGCALEQTRDLDELDANTADGRDRGDRARRRERVVAGLDLDLRQRLQKRRLARVGCADQRDLRGTLAAHCDRVAMDDLRSNARLGDLLREPLPDVRVRAAAVVRQLLDETAQHANALDSDLSDQPALGHLDERAMRHGHRSISSPSCGQRAAQPVTGRESRPVLPLPWTLELEAAD